MALDFIIIVAILIYNFFVLSELSWDFIPIGVLMP